MNPADVAITAAAAAPVAEVTVPRHVLLQASLLVKLVMLALLGSSIWSWAIIVNKSIMYARFQRAMDKFESRSSGPGTSLEELYSTLSSRPAHGMASLFVAAMREWKRSVQNVGSSFMGLQARIDKVLERLDRTRGSSGSRRTLLFLATVASAGPFVGLFGTVWGIMTSFRSIAASKNTSLAVVAPGIAEALLATALGLFAAIPALVAYNKLQGEVAKKQGAHGRLRRRVLGHPVAPDRPAFRPRPRGLRR